MKSLEKSDQFFSHSGFISRVAEDSITVTLEPNIHCESCHAKGSCGVSGSDTKQIEVHSLNDSFQINEKVKVNLRKTTGLIAVFWAYVFPFLLMVFTLVLTSLFVKEWVAGVLSLFVLMPYYTILYVLKNKLKSSFRISILKT
ncbi:SoxR reducing system RseC family protein [Winogradskyella alexanderae]|uniref:SoxR reducing system RseC family protein n=1 Tax=Winogradskyella alexanderae TaxID=2877123 RepID=A0ABS7XNK1_9FLAO|nr:SoxR reducing system RseC family protein [Winogradskyella alexanderae]MCA0131568.1 SoxR reducing system RseC family protein [Winogradskyella alexanderae]